MAEKSVHYVNNKEFLNEYIVWRERYDLVLDDTGEQIQITDSMAKNIIKICNGLSYMPNFRNYTYREEMVEDAIEYSIRYFKTFNPEKSSNIFGYVSMIAYNACVQRINREKKQMAIKARYIQGVAINDIPIADMSNSDNDSLDQMKEYLTSYYDFDLDAYDLSRKGNKVEKIKVDKSELIGPLGF